MTQGTRGLPVTKAQYINARKVRDRLLTEYETIRRRLLEQETSVNRLGERLREIEPGLNTELLFEVATGQTRCAMPVIARDPRKDGTCSRTAGVVVGGQPYCDAHAVKARQFLDDARAADNEETDS